MGEDLVIEGMLPESYSLLGELDRSFLRHGNSSPYSSNEVIGYRKIDCAPKGLLSACEKDESCAEQTRQAGARSSILISRLTFQ
jgi:hypothetical protein